MRLDLASWQEVESYLMTSSGIIIPAGSTEQHGPMGLIGTDSLCAEQIAYGAGEKMNVYVAPTLAYSPAPFNMSFPGTVSISVSLFESLISEVISSLESHGFTTFYFINGHGANTVPLTRVAAKFSSIKIRVKSWWDYDHVDKLRRDNFGEWEGMHATPSEISITQTNYRILSSSDAINPPRKITASYIKEHAGDRHGPPDEHRLNFPDGRVGSHSALASTKIGKQLIKAAINALVEDYLRMK